MTLVLDVFFLLCTCGFLHFEPWERGEHDVLVGREHWRKSLGRTLCPWVWWTIVGLIWGTGTCNLLTKGWRRMGGRCQMSTPLKIIRKRRGLDRWFYSEDLPRPRTVKLLRTGVDPAGPWGFLLYLGWLGGMGCYHNALMLSASVSASSSLL